MDTSTSNNFLETQMMQQKIQNNYVNKNTPLDFSDQMDTCPLSPIDQQIIDKMPHEIHVTLQPQDLITDKEDLMLIDLIDEGVTTPSIQVTQRKNFCLKRGIYPLPSSSPAQCSFQYHSTF